MTARAVEAYSGAAMREAGSCTACNLLWFDDSGSISLTPRAVLELFQYIGQAAGNASDQRWAWTQSLERLLEPLLDL